MEGVRRVRSGVPAGRRGLCRAGRVAIAFEVHERDADVCHLTRAGPARVLASGCRRLGPRGVDLEVDLDAPTGDSDLPDDESQDTTAGLWKTESFGDARPNV